jgi:hypothetical protein
VDQALTIRHEVDHEYDFKGLFVYHPWDKLRGTPHASGRGLAVTRWRRWL